VFHVRVTMSVPFQLKAWDYTSSEHKLLTDDGDKLCYFYGCNNLGTKIGFSSARSDIDRKRIWCDAHYEEMRIIAKKKSEAKSNGSLFDSIKARMEELLKNKTPDLRHLHQVNLEIRALRHNQPIMRRTNTNIVLSKECRAYGCSAKLLEQEQQNGFCDYHRPIHRQIIGQYSTLTCHEEAINLLCEEIAFYKTTANYRVAEILILIHDKQKLEDGWTYNFD
jgi:hypothetical protein